MKLLFIVSLLWSSMFLFGQEPQPCAQFPVANPDVSANFSDELAVKISEKMSEAVILQSEREGIIKLIISCDGTVKSCIAEDENLSKEDCANIRLAVQEIVWTPALNKDRQVTSTYFLKVRFNGNTVTVSKA